MWAFFFSEQLEDGFQRGTVFSFSLPLVVGKDGIVLRRWGVGCCDDVVMVMGRGLWRSRARTHVILC